MTELVWLKNSDKGVTVREYLTIIEWGWAKYRNLSVASRSIICQSQRLRQITDLRNTDKSRYFATNKLNELVYHLITEFVFLRNVFGKRSNLPFSLKSNIIATRREVWFHLPMSSISFAAKKSWMTVRMSRPLFVGTYLQVTWWALSQWKGRKICNKW